MSKPIYDQPNHPRYGPARRLHIMVMQLTADDPTVLERIDEWYWRRYRTHWSQYLSGLMDNTLSEAYAQRRVLKEIFSLCHGGLAI